MGLAVHLVVHTSIWPSLWALTIRYPKILFLHCSQSSQPVALAPICLPQDIVLGDWLYLALIVDMLVLLMNLDLHMRVCVCMYVYVCVCAHLCVRACALLLNTVYARSPGILLKCRYWFNEPGCGQWDFTFLTSSRWDCFCGSVCTWLVARFWRTNAFWPFWLYSQPQN